MSDKNYVNILIESLQKKIELLDRLSELDRQQESILTAEKYDNDAFDQVIEKKTALITKLDFMDSGFDATYNRIKRELVGNRDQYREEIKKLQELIAIVTEKSAGIQAMELRVQQKLQSTFRGERQKLRQSKTTVQAVTGYYKTMSNTAYVDSQYLDQKK